MLTRRSTPQVLQKLGKNPRDREREWEEERWWEDERESFPQFCMTCEKQFIPQDQKILYCSEACRKHDQSVTSQPTSHPSARSRDILGASALPYYSPGAGASEPRDIIPRASPSRPNSKYFSPPTTPTSVNYTSAVSALRSLSIRPPSPPSPSAPMATTHNAGIWPFAKSAANSPSSSYTKPTNFFSTTYDSGYGASGYGYNYGRVAGERPLPSRRPGDRPKSIELVTPMVGR